MRAVLTLGTISEDVEARYSSCVQTLSGKIKATEYDVLFEGRWRRVMRDQSTGQYFIHVHHTRVTVTL